jgi:hypothetical protein
MATLGNLSNPVVHGRERLDLFAIKTRWDLSRRPIVLLYVFDGKSPAQLSTCYINALKLNPVTVTE